MGKHRFEGKDHDEWGGPELAEKRHNSTRHSRDQEREARGDTSVPEQPSPDVAKI